MHTSFPYKTAAVCVPFCTVSVRKTGSGSWTLGGDLLFSGSLSVDEGTLTVRKESGIYDWFRWTLKEQVGEIVEYRLADNDNGCNLHSDFKTGFHKQLWNTELLPDGIRFFRTSPNGEAGFPGNLDISVIYTLDEANGQHICYEGVSDRKTLINLTNHSFFNLSGHNAGSVLDHRVTLNCGSFLEISAGRLPTGRILPVTGTAMDFLSGRRIGDTIDTDWDQLRFAAGYDHCFVTGAESGKLKKIALVEDPHTGCRMEVSTDLPGVQFYSANFLPSQAGKGGAHYGPRCALCLETEYFPDSIHFPDFPQCVFDAGQIYQAETVYRFL